MKKYIYVLMVLIMTGCFGGNNKSQNSLTAATKKVEATQSKLDSNKDNKIKSASAYAWGVAYSLNSVTNAPVEVFTALTYNDRIQSIVGMPDVDAISQMKRITDLMNSKVSEERAKGAVLLAAKDKDLSVLQDENVKLNALLTKQESDYKNKAAGIAALSDENAGKLAEMNSWFGIGAIWYGLKRFVFSSLTTLLIVGVVFLLLRTFAASNPIVGAIFGIFESFGAMVINTVKNVFPKSIDLSNLVHTEEHLTYKETLNKIVDTIETFKNNCELANKTCSLGELLEELDRVMDQKDKDCIKAVLKDQKWT